MKKVEKLRQNRGVKIGVLLEKEKYHYGAGGGGGVVVFATIYGGLYIPI
jgi:hypothetical protein